MVGGASQETGRERRKHVPVLHWVALLLHCNRTAGRSRRSSSSRRRRILSHAPPGGPPLLPSAWPQPPLHSSACSGCGSAENGFLEPFIYKKRSFCQDRLGTNIGKTQKKMPFSAPMPPASAPSSPRPGHPGTPGRRSPVETETARVF
jgi:hypothetical protein